MHNALKLASCELTCKLYGMLDIALMAAVVVIGEMWLFLAVIAHLVS